MSVPTPAERPDLYDGYNGLPEGTENTIEVNDPDYITARIAARKAELAAAQGSAAEAPAK